MKTQPVVSSEAKLGHEVMDTRGRDDIANAIVTEWSPETGIAAPREVNGSGIEKRFGERVHDVAVWESRKQIPDFEETLNEIDDAICNGARSLNFKATGSEKTANQIDSNLNLVNVVIIEDDPVLEIQEQDQNGKLVELNTDAMMTKVEFSMG